MNSREEILQRIHKAVSGNSETTPMPEVPEVWPIKNPDSATMTAQFIDEIQAVTGEVYHCAKMQQAREKLLEIADQEGWKSFAAVDRPLCREVVSDMEEGRVLWAASDWNAPSMADLPAGLIAADRLLADTGTCMIACATAEERLMCYLPPVCIIVARVDQLVEHLPAVWGEVAQRAADPQLRGEFVFITGPSRTADIEKILILGVHGPKRLIVLLVEEAAS